MRMCCFGVLRLPGARLTFCQMVRVPLLYKPGVRSALDAYVEAHLRVDRLAAARHTHALGARVEYALDTELETARADLAFEYARLHNALEQAVLEELDTDTRRVELLDALRALTEV